MASSIDSIYLVEASPSLRDAQKQLLCGDAPMKEVEAGFRSKSKHLGLSITWCEDLRFVPNGECTFSFALDCYFNYLRYCSINFSRDIYYYCS